MKNIYKLKILFVLTSALIGGAIHADALPDDPFYKGPDYNDYDDAKGYVSHAMKYNLGKPLWIEPADNISYADYRYVGSHNSHVYYRFFNTVYQHRHTITHQLMYGVRGLMLDTYDWKLSAPAAMRGPSGSDIVLSHAEPGFVAFTQKGHNSYQALKYEMNRVVEFMRENPKAIITIILENYGDLAKTASDIEEVMKERGYNVLFRPSDKGTKKWSDITLGWMRKYNKRLVIFTQRGGNTSCTFSQFPNMYENQYSILDTSGTNTNLCKEREESPKYGERELVAFNNFSGDAVTHAAGSIKGAVSYNTVKNLMTLCSGKGFANKRYFNGYWADRIIDCCNELLEGGQKTIFHYCTEQNTVISLIKMR